MPPLHRRPSRALCLLPLLLLLQGCAGFWMRIPTNKGYSALLDTWSGDDATLLAAAWGPPHSTSRIGLDHVVWTYNRSVSTTTPKTYTTNYDPIRDALVTKQTGGQTITRWCRVDFTVQKGKITHWRWQGNSCRAVPPPHLGAYLRTDEACNCVVVEAVEPGTTAERLGLTRGSKLGAVNKTPVYTVGDVQAQLSRRFTWGRLDVIYRRPDGVLVRKKSLYLPHPKWR